jgi:hypothetical protein
MDVMRNEAKHPISTPNVPGVEISRSARNEKL